MRENRTLGSVRGAPGNGRSYRDNKPFTEIIAVESTLVDAVAEDAKHVPGPIAVYENAAIQGIVDAYDVAEGEKTLTDVIVDNATDAAETISDESVKK